MYRVRQKSRLTVKKKKKKNCGFFFFFNFFFFLTVRRDWVYGSKTRPRTAYTFFVRGSVISYRLDRNVGTKENMRGLNMLLHT